MSIVVPLRKWRSADPAILIGRRCIARTDDDVVIDGRLELIRRPDGAATDTTCSEESGYGIKECIVTLSDTRKVDCVVHSGYRRGGLSCDWSHVSGADKEPER